MTVEQKRDELQQHYLGTRAELLNSLEGLSPEQLQEPTLDAGWSVKDLLAHIAQWDELRLLEMGRVAAGYQPAYRGMTAEQVEASNALSVELRRVLPMQQVMWELASARQRLLDFAAQADERTLDNANYGNAPPRTSHDLLHADQIRRWRQERGY